jgi:hypothetical protein
VDFSFDHDNADLDVLRGMIRGEVRIMEARNAAARSAAARAEADAPRGGAAGAEKASRERVKRQKELVRKQRAAAGSVARPQGDPGNPEDDVSPSSQGTETTAGTGAGGSAFSTPAGSPMEKVSTKAVLERKRSGRKLAGGAGADAIAVTPVDVKGGGRMVEIGGEGGGVVVKESPAAKKQLSRTRSRLQNAILQAGGGDE